MPHSFYSQRTGTAPHPVGLPFADIISLFKQDYYRLANADYFAQAFGRDWDGSRGYVFDVAREILCSIHKRALWPIDQFASHYSEEDLFDIIEFLYQHVSKPIYKMNPEDELHKYIEWDKSEGQRLYREKINELLSHYEQPFELSETGEVLRKPEAGFEELVEAEVSSQDPQIVDRVNAAVNAYRRHGRTRNDQRQAVRDLADVLERIRPAIKNLVDSSEPIVSQDEKELFNIANNFGIRHNKTGQKTDYDPIWLDWLFYMYLATIQVTLKKIPETAG